MADRNVTILHLSDIHRTRDESVSNENILFSLSAELRRQQQDEGLPKPDLLVVSGDLTQSAKEDEYNDAYVLIDTLKNELTVPELSRVILVPGNHDINWDICETLFKAGPRQPEKTDPTLTHSQGGVHFWTDEKTYIKRLDPFRVFYRKIYGRDYGITRRDQFDVWAYPELDVCFVGLNSCDHVDHLRFRGAINEEAFFAADAQLPSALTRRSHCIKIAVWHHDLNWLGRPGQEDGLEPSILGHLADAGYDLALCGHSHRTEFNNYKYPGFHLPVVAAGSLCAGPRQRQESIPRLFNLIHIQGSTARVYSRSRETKDVPWRPYARWGKPPIAHFDINISELVATRSKTISSNRHNTGEIPSVLVAPAHEYIASSLDKIERLLRENRANDLSAVIRDAIEQGLGPVYSTLDNIGAILHKDGYDVQTDEVGTILIDDSATASSRLDQTLILKLQTDMTRLRKAITGRDPTEAELNELEQRYRQHIIRQFDRMSFQGMMRVARAISLPLEELYVELCAVAEVPESADIFSVEERRLLSGVESKDPDKQHELLRELDALRRERWNARLPEHKSICETLYTADDISVVILGDPGSGKTTLLHVLALVYAKGPQATQKTFGVPVTESDRLPIFVPLAAYDDLRRHNPGLALVDFLALYYDRRRGLPGLAPLFRRALESGRALILLDGLDEVLDVSTRGMIAEQVNALIGEWTEHGVRFAVTSRFVGYREAPLSGDLLHLSVMDFRQQEIEAFIHKWTLAYERFAAGLATETESTPEVLQKAHQHEANLLDDIKCNPGVRRLAANPLMLTMLALLRRQVGRLPHRRVLLYERYVSTLIENWVEARSHGEREQSVEMLDPHDAESILIPLALWLQQSTQSGTAGNAEVHAELLHICLQEAGHNVDTATRSQIHEAEKKAQRFLHDMRQMAGLIIERGHDAYGFLHLTFQEYFVGRALARLTDEERWKAIRSHLHNARWRESLLLCAGQLGVVEKRRPQVTEFVRRTLNCADDTEPDLHRNLLLALAIAAGDVNLDPTLISDLLQRATTCLSTRVHSLDREIIRHMGQLVANGVEAATQALTSVLDAGNALLRIAAMKELANFTMIPAICAMVLARLDDQVWEVRVAAVRALTGVLDSDAQIRDAVFARLEDSELQVCRAAIETLTGLVESDVEVRTAMLARLEDEKCDQYGIVRTAAVRALAGLVDSDSRIRAAILSVLSNRSRDFLGQDCAAAVNALTGLIDTDPQVRATMLALLDDSTDPMETGRRSAIYALAGLVDSDLRVRAAILSVLSGDSSGLLGNAKAAAVDALAGLVDSDPQVCTAIKTMLNDKSYLGRSNRTAAVRALTGLLDSDAQVRDAVLAILDDTDNWDYQGGTRVAAVQALTGLLDSDAQVRDAIVLQISANNWHVRQVVAQTLGDMLSDTSHDSHQQNIELLAGSLLFLEHEDVARSRLSAFKAMSVLVSSDDLVRVAVMGRLEDENWLFRRGSIEILTGLIGSDPQVLPALLVRLEDEMSDIRSAAVQALSGLVGSDVKVCAAVLARLEDSESHVREAAIKALEELVDSDSEVRIAMLARLDDQEWKVRVAAVEALTELLLGDSQLRARAMSWLKDEEPHIRSAAVQALTGLVGSDAKVRAAVLTRLEDEESYVRVTAIEALTGLVENDVEVRAAMLARLEDEESYVRAFVVKALTGPMCRDSRLRAQALLWLKDEEPYIRSAAVQALSNLVSSDAKVCAAVLARLEDEVAYIRVATVQALTGLVSSDTQVRTALLTRLDDKESEVRTAAVQALSGQLESDTELCVAVLARFDDKRSDIRATAVQALSGLVGGNAQVRAAVLARLDDQVWDVRAAAVQALAGLKEEDLTSDELMTIRSWLATDIDTIRGNSEDTNKIRQMLAPHIAMRVADDPEQRSWVMGLLTDARYSARLGAMQVLAKWPGGPPREVIQSMLASLDDLRGLESYPARLTAASYLINRDPHSAQAIEVCLQALDYGTQPWEYFPESFEIRQQAALVLGKLEPTCYDTRVYSKLQQVMVNDQSLKVRDAAYAVMVRLAGVKKAN
ncbi:MAG: NACHT domain-containing protein [Deltaproteobacteria bacterium]|nr:NACHT domain-containing protein [Deltaproteobacteria bacterium]